jgi:catechol 2,3-dioxygenase-like lactoylglutathione lyase family enzyme
VTTNDKKSSIGKPVPELPVADVELAQQHYKDRLGFDVGWTYPDKQIGAVVRGNSVIFFRRKTPLFEPSVNWIFAEDIDALYQEYKTRGAFIADPLEVKPWGLRQFAVRDLDGNLFYFHHDAPGD